jgi:Tol biopolymer transport system component
MGTLSCSMRWESCGERRCRWPAAAPHQRSGVFEYQPSFSADGSKLLYTTWSDATDGRIVERDLASGSERKLSTQQGFYYGPQYSRDGSASSMHAAAVAA